MKIIIPMDSPTGKTWAQMPLPRPTISLYIFMIAVECLTFRLWITVDTSLDEALEIERSTRYD